MEKIYYAHSMKIYNSDQEKKELIFLKKIFKNIHNPNQIKYNNYQGMGKFLDMVDGCFMVVFSEYQNHIGRGVYEEIEHSFKTNKPVLLLRDGKLIQINQDQLEFIDINWGIEYGKINNAH